MTTKMFPNQGKKWSMEDQRDPQTIVRCRNMTLGETADRFGRSPYAIECKVGDLCSISSSMPQHIPIRDYDKWLVHVDCTPVGGTVGIELSQYRKKLRAQEKLDEAIADIPDHLQPGYQPFPWEVKSDNISIGPNAGNCNETVAIGSGIGVAPSLSFEGLEPNTDHVLRIQTDALSGTIKSFVCKAGEFTPEQIADIMAEMPGEAVQSNSVGYNEPNEEINMSYINNLPKFETVQQLDGSNIDTYKTDTLIGKVAQYRQRQDELVELNLKIKSSAISDAIDDLEKTIVALVTVIDERAELAKS